MWKDTERRIARILGGRRVGPSGTDTPDVVSDWLVVEVKHRKTLPAWLHSALAQARHNSGTDRLGIVVLHEQGRRSQSDMVLLSLADFIAWFGDADTAHARARKEKP